MCSTKPNGLAAFARSFRYAARGLWRCVREERNFRFHLAAAAYVLGFASQLALTRVEWAVLSLTIGAVLCAELVNSALERAVDRVSTAQHPLAGAAKDLSAAAVLVCAAAAVGVGVALFFRPADWATLLAGWSWWQPCLLLGSLPLAYAFVFRGNRPHQS